MQICSSLILLSLEVLQLFICICSLETISIASLYQIFLFLFFRGSFSHGVFSFFSICEIFCIVHGYLIRPYCQDPYCTGIFLVSTISQSFLKGGVGVN